MNNIQQYGKDPENQLAINLMSLLELSDPAAFL